MSEHEHTRRTLFEAMMQSNADIRYCLDYFEEQADTERSNNAQRRDL